MLERTERDSDLSTRAMAAYSTDGQPTSWGVRLIVAGLLLSILSGHSHRLGFPVGPDRILVAAGVLLLAVTGRFSQPPRLRWRTVHTLMAATVGWTLWSAMAHQTLFTEYGFYALLDRIVVPFVLFGIAPVAFARPEERRLLLKALVALTLYLSVTAIFEVAGPQALVFPRYILDPDVGILFGRARGPAVSPETDGLVMAAVAFAAGLVGLRYLRGAWRLASGALLPLATVGILFTLTRSIWLGTAVGMIAIAILSPMVRKRLLVVVAGGSALVGGLLVAIPSLRELIVERLTTERSVYDRQNTNAAALRMIFQHPIDGVGWARYTSVNVDWVRQADTYPVTNVEIEVHNVVLSRGAELGLIGAALWVGCVLAGPALAIVRRPADSELQRWRVALAGFACVWGVTIMLSPTPYALPNNLLWLLAGLVLRDYLAPHDAHRQLGRAEVVPASDDVSSPQSSRMGPTSA